VKEKRVSSNKNGESESW